MDVFVDTSGWASFFLRSERFHSPAETLMRQWQKQGRRVVTTNYVLTELIALFMSPLRVPRPTAIRYVETVLGSSWVEVVHIDATLHTAAWSLMKARADKEWSWVDCASFVVMQQRGLTEALTTDHHFEQAGFERLLK